MRRRSELIRRDLPMPTAHPALTRRATTNVNSISFDFGLRRGRQFGVGDGLFARVNEFAAAIRASIFPSPERLQLARCTGLQQEQDDC